MSSDFACHGKYHAYVGTAVDIGDRDKMEDEFVINFTPTLSYLGVYDGHAGSSASRFVRDNLCKTFYNKVNAQTQRRKEKLSCAIHDAYLDVDREYFTFEQEEMKQTNKTMCSGSTAVSVVVNLGEGWGFVANAGDSRAILAHQGHIITLSNDHRIERAGETSAERERVISQGGWIEDGLLCGQLEPTRGIGDHDFKRLKNAKFPRRTFIGDPVIPDPEVQWFSLEENAEEIRSANTNSLYHSEFIVGTEENHYSFMVIATDGLWDAMSTPIICQFLNQHFKKALYKQKPINSEVVQKIADELLQNLRKMTRTTKYAMDNSTIILLCFVKCADASHYNQKASSCLHCFQPSSAPNVPLISSATAQKMNKKRNQRRQKTNNKTKNKAKSKNKPKRK